MSREEKLDILRRVDKAAREADKRVQEVNASLTGVYELILVAATGGASGGGGRFGYEYFLADLDGEVRADAWAKEAVRMALVNLSAVAAPADCCTKRSGTGWKVILTVVGRLYLAVRSASRLPPRFAP